MRVSRLFALLLPLMIAAALTACGNKGDLVKPTPSTLPPPTPTDQPTTPAQPSANDTTPKPAADSGGH